MIRMLLPSEAVSDGMFMCDCWSRSDLEPIPLSIASLDAVKVFDPSYINHWTTVCCAREKIGAELRYALVA